MENEDQKTKPASFFTRLEMDKATATCVVVSLFFGTIVALAAIDSAVAMKLIDAVVPWTRTQFGGGA